MFFITVRSFGIIGGGAVLFAATSLAGQAVLPAVGEERKRELVPQESKINFFQASEEQQRQQEEPEQLACLLSALHALASAACSGWGEGEGSYVHDPASYIRPKICSRIP